MIDLINAGYLASSAIAASAGLSPASRTGARCWLALSVGLLIFGLLRIGQAGLFLDYYLEVGLRAIGWYDHRRPLQIACIFSFGAALFLTLTRLRSVLKKGPLTAAVSAFYMLAVYTAIRASSLHWSDAMLGQRVGSVTLGHLAQFVLLVALSAAGLVEVLSNKISGTAKRHDNHRGSRPRTS